MEQSPKSQKFEESTATYIINAHGTMLTSRFPDNDRWFSTVTKKYHAINIPKNVELYTFANLGNCLAAYEAEADFLCNIHPDKHKLTLRKSINPTFKFSHQHGEANKFPELLLTPERNFPVGFYTGILHCIPEALRKTDSLGKEVIYDIGAKNTKDCECSSILLKEQAEAYDCDKKYSNYYKEKLRGYKYNPATNINESGPILLNEDLGVIQPQGNTLRSYKYSPATKYNINKCGPILLSEALEVIQTHCNTYYKSNCVIQIYIIACLEEEDLLTLVRRFTESYAIAEQLVRQGSPKLYSTEEPRPKFISTEETSQEACLALNSPQFCFAKLLPTHDSVSSDEKALDKLLATIVPPPPRPNSPHPRPNSPHPRPNSIQPLSIESIIASLLDSSKKKDTKEKKKNVGRMEHYYEAMNHNTFAKVDKQNVVESLSDFKGTPLTKPLYDTHIFMYNAKVFNIKTFKDAFIEFNGVYDDKFTGTIQERDKKLEEKYRALSKKKLHSQLLTALQRFNVKHDDDDLYYDNGVIIPTELDILPKTNEINLALPFNITTTSEYLPTNMAEIIYTQLLKLIALEKAKKLGQGRKTLRNKGKKGKKDKKPKSQKKPKKPKKIIH
jgi:hypothetical protein